MASEILINRLYQMIDEIARLGGEQERTSIVPGILVADANPSDLPTGYIKIVNPRDGTYVPCLTVNGLVVSDNDLVNVLFTKGTEPIALSQSAGSPSSSIKVYQLWESDFGAVAWQTNATGHLSAAGAYDLTTTGDIDGADITASDNVMADAHGFIVKNTSGAAATAGDVGYINEDGEYKTTTTAADERPRPVLVLVGGANNADIYVTEGPGIGVMSYVGVGPSSGDYLEFSTTAGSVQSNGTIFHPGIVAQASAAGSGGTVAVKLLLRTIPWVAGSSNSIYQPNSGLTTTAPSSDWSGTIDSLPGGAIVRYDNTGGDEAVLKPASTSQVGKVVLHNTTRGDSALISDADTTGGAGYDGEITLTDTVPAGWLATDVITIRSQTNTANLGTAFFVDLQLGSELPDTIRSIDLGMSFNNSAAANLRAGVHPFEANVGSKRQLFRNQVANQVTTTGAIRLRVVDKKICLLWQESGAGNDSNYLLELRAYNLAA